MVWLGIVFALLAGASNPLQSATNAGLRAGLAQSLWTTAWVYGSGLAGTLLIQAFVRQPLPSWSTAAHVPWWAWTGGLLSIVATFAGLTLAQRLGSGIFTGLTITSAIAISIALDHFGLLGMRQHNASPVRLLGGVMMVAGVWLVARF